MQSKYGNLPQMLLLGLCSIMGCSKDSVDMKEFGKNREEWLCGFMELSNEIRTYKKEP